MFNKKKEPTVTCVRQYSITGPCGVGGALSVCTALLPTHLPLEAGQLDEHEASNMQWSLYRSSTKHSPCQREVFANAGGSCAPSKKCTRQKVVDH